MTNFKTIEIIEKYKSIIETTEPDKITSDDKFFVCNIELELAKSILQDFGDKTSFKLGQILSVETKEENKCASISHYGWTNPYNTYNSVTSHCCKNIKQGMTIG